jgi:ankyrin repeat protein
MYISIHILIAILEDMVYLCSDMHGNIYIHTYIYKYIIYMDRSFCMNSEGVTPLYVTLLNGHIEIANNMIYKAIKINVYTHISVYIHTYV